MEIDHNEAMERDAHKIRAGVIAGICFTIVFLNFIRDSIMKTLKWENKKGALGGLFFRACGGKYIYAYTKIKDRYLLMIDTGSVEVSFPLRTEKACKDIANNLEFK